MSDLMEILVNNIVKTGYEDLTDEAIEYVKKSTLDTIAAALAGSAAAGCHEVVDLVKELGGKKQSTIWVYGGRVPTALAALAIGPMARASELGDVHAGGGGHVSEYIVPAAIPAAESMGKVDGKKFILSVALAQDLMARLGMSYNVTKRWRMYRIFGPTAAVARIMDLDKNTMLNAMGIAYAQTAGDMQTLLDGGQTLYIEHGFVAEAAIKSVLMAEKGITGARNILQGDYGFYKAFEPEYNLDVVTAGLGSRYEGAYLSMKPYACCMRTHAAVNATIDLIQEHSIEPSDITEIDIGISEKAFYHTYHPVEEKRQPRNAVEATMSLPYAVATAAVKGSVFIDDFRGESINRPDVREIMKMVKARIAPEVILPDNKLVGGAVVTMKTKDGQEFHKSVDYVKGHPQKPMDMADVIEKFHKCLPFSARPLKQKNVDELLDIVTNLEQSDNVGRIAGLLVS